ncbi:hypothetical protein [Nocardioides maradonensis]
MQKPVLQVLDRRGATIAFAKVSTNEHTDRLVDHEARALRAFGRRAPAGLRTPALLHEGDWRGCRLTVQEALRGDARLPVTADLRAAAASGLAAAWGTFLRPIADSAFAGRLLERVGPVPRSPWEQRLREAVETAFDRTGELDLTFGAAHGDWVPWNMVADGGRLAVWDWEGLVTDVPVGFDELHWRVNSAVAIKGQAPQLAVPEQIRGAIGALSDSAGGRRRAQVTALWYVLDLATRYVQEGEDLLGATPLSRLDTWLVPTLVPLLDDVLKGASA